MSIRSHVDPCSFVVFLHIRNEQLSDELAEVVRALRVQHGESLTPVLERLQLRSHQILAHETYHYWQGLRLPFLFRYATIAFVRAWQAFIELVKQGGIHYADWSCVLPEFARLDLDARVGYAPGGNIFWGGPEAEFPPETVRELRVTALSLAECATSLAEFQITQEHADRVRPLALTRWRKRNPANLEPYDFAAEFLGSETLALRVLLPLVNAAFHTTEPTRTFAELLARVWGNFVVESDGATLFLSQPEPTRWPELFQHWLSRIEYDGPEAFDVDLLAGPYQRITLDRWVYGSFGSASAGESMIHPFLGLPARKWRESEAAHPQLSWALDFPGYVDEKTWTLLRRDFSPPLRVLRFHMPDGADRTVLWGRGVGREFTTFENPGDESFRGFLVDFLTIYGVVRRASGAHFDEDQRTCYHRDCAHYAANFCNAYPIVPQRHEDCGFPNRIDRLVQLEHHRHALTPNRSR